MGEKVPQYLVTEDKGLITLTINYRDTGRTSAHTYNGLRQAMSNGDLFRVIQHNSLYSYPLLKSELVEKLVVAFPEHRDNFEWCGREIALNIDTSIYETPTTRTLLQNAELYVELAARFNEKGFDLSSAKVSSTSVYAIVGERT